MPPSSESLEHLDRRWPSQWNGSRNSESLTGVAQDIGRTLPHSIDAEQGVLGSMLISPQEIIAECAAKITGEFFYVPAHQTIYLVLIELWDRRQGIDLITFTQVLRDRNLLETVGGAAAVTSLFTFVPTAANVTYYLEIVREKYILRQIIATGTELVRRAFEEQGEVYSVLDLAQEKITGLSIDATGRGESLRHIRDGVMDTLERFETAHAHRGQEVVTGLATGFHDLDRMLTGLKEQQLVTIAGLTSHGKSAVAGNIAEYVGHVLRQPVGIWSMEMSYIEEVERLVCGVSNTSLQRLKDGFLKDADFPRIREAAGGLISAPIYVDDTRGLSIAELKAMVRRAVARWGLKLVIVDYIQLMSSSTKRARENRVLEISEITGGLKSLAKELAIPVIGLAQLSREADKRAAVFRRPKLSDLKESSSIEQDSDVVIVVWRPGRFVETEQDAARLEKNLELEQLNQKTLAAVRRQEEIDGKAIPFIPLSIDNYAELIVLKQRTGAVSKKRGVPVRYEGDLTKFHSITPKMWSNRADERQPGYGNGVVDEDQEERGLEQGEL